jgi:hypothetical protein
MAKMKNNWKKKTWRFDNDMNLLIENLKECENSRFDNEHEQ